MLRVLCIEDQADIQMLLKMTLEASGRFQVHAAESGGDGLASAETLELDAILLDFTLPDMDAPAVLDGLKQRPQTAGIPVILLSATTRPEAVADCKARGAIGSLTKPFNPRTLAGEIETLLAANGSP